MHVHVHTTTLMYVCMYACMYSVCMYVCMHVCMYVILYSKKYQGFIQGGVGNLGFLPPPKKLYFIHYDNQEKLI